MSESASADSKEATLVILGTLPMQTPQCVTDGSTKAELGGRPVNNGLGGVGGIGKGEVESPVSIEVLVDRTASWSPGDRHLLAREV